MALFQLLKMKGEAQAALLFFAISVPVMSFVPTVSHDYKLVIFSPAVLILLAAILTHIRRDQGISGYVQLAFLFFILLFIGRSYVYDGLFGLEMLKNKYVWCLFLEGLTGFVIQREKCLPALVEVS